MITETSTTRRQCFYIPVDQFDESGYIPSMVTEGIAGHTPMNGNGPHAQPWHWGTSYKEARAICDGENLKIGITPEVASEIVLSSMTAGTWMEAGNRDLLDQRLAAVIDVILADAERLGITWKFPNLYYRDDGRNPDHEPPEGWRDMLAGQAERLGWATYGVARADR